MLSPDKVQAWDLLEQLRAPEGASVTLFCDNPDFIGSNNKIAVCDDWTQWVDRVFDGDTVVDALKAALTARAAVPSVQRTEEDRG